ncbi:MAG: diguanylate cyclase [Deltaproteobacteria bacterium]|jgi:diguanylate cyclase (GGDEF)-like protein|nr:diguanylate cyclase [Deltaproteobacteria bacterium]
MVSNEFQHNELSAILKSCRRLSNILEIDQLYSVFAEVLQNKFSIRRLAIFDYHKTEKKLSLVYSMGLGDINFEIRETDTGLWKSILNGEPFDVSDDSGKLLFSKDFKQLNLERLQSQLWVPLSMGDELIGLVTIGRRKNNLPFDASNRYFLQQLSAHAVVCMNTCRQYEKRRKEKEDLDKTLQNLSLLYSIGKAMNYISDLKNLLQYILSKAIEVTFAEKGSLMLYDMETDKLNIRVLAGMEDTAFQEQVNNNEIDCRSFKPGEGIAGRVYMTAKPLVVNNIKEDDIFIDSEKSYVRSIACIPMVVFNDVIGVINVTNKRHGQAFTAEDVEMLKAVADQAAVAINKAQLWDMAVTDSLTGLFVRRYFLVKLQEELHRAERYNNILSVVMADLDRFKNINDTYGHDAGDRALKAIGKFLQQNIRDVDVVARYGGEEFVIMIPEAANDAALILAERLRRQMSELKIKDLPPITISLGIASFPNDGSDIEDLIKKADAAMYAAKRAGRDQAVKYTPDIPLVREGDPEAHQN